MPTRQDLSGVAHNVAQAFLSRENDLDGYWAPGRLYLDVKNAGRRTSVLDLRATAVADLDSEKALVKSFTSRIDTIFTRRGLPISWLAEACLTIDFEAPTGGLPRLAWDDGSRPFLCTVRLVDDRGRVYTSALENWCRPHDPSRESRRAPAVEPLEPPG